MEAPPPRFICPITKKVMFDPVFAQDGYVYERYAISKYLRNFVDATLEETEDMVIPHTYIKDVNNLREFLIELRDAPKEEQKAKMVFIRHAALRREIASSAFAPKVEPLLTPMVAASKFAFDRSTTGYFMFVASERDLVFKPVAFMEFADDVCVFEFREDDRILVLQYDSQKTLYHIIYDSNISNFKAYKDILHVLFIGSEEKSPDVQLVLNAIENNHLCNSTIEKLVKVMEKDIHDQTDDDDFDVVLAKLKRVKKNILPNLMNQLGFQIPPPTERSSCPIQ